MSRHWIQAFGWRYEKWAWRRYISTVQRFLTNRPWSTPFDAAMIGLFSAISFSGGNLHGFKPASLETWTRTQHRIAACDLLLLLHRRRHSSKSDAGTLVYFSARHLSYHELFPHLGFAHCWRLIYSDIRFRRRLKTSFRYCGQAPKSRHEACFWCLLRPFLRFPLCVLRLHHFHSARRAVSGRGKSS